MGQENRFGIPAPIWEQMIERTAITLADLLDSAPQFQKAVATDLLEDALSVLQSEPSPRLFGDSLSCDTCPAPASIVAGIDR